ncbi:DUF2634 domain-containing protein [Paenibacillus popilliae]|uniref:DUF2634 domain-containing protein n=1 Tax=Paenibacillus popilliae ATCC 14706 TaxID=1212764 RepID=M9LNG8_PAEPP|nr:DUF2634 domain-containing protein [Paenibacillus popilliae]GAC41911.1 hypothetical protein PPOP_1268 [Paenibacillus popilliae ATCC 14706]
MLTPRNADGLTIGDVEVQTDADRPSLTYNIDFDTGRIRGVADGLDAVKQAIHMVLQTERFAHTIFSWGYGTEMGQVVGKSEPVLQSEIKRIITEALTADERITDVKDFTFKLVDKRTAAVSFTAVSVFGDIPFSREVNT